MANTNRKVSDYSTRNLLKQGGIMMAASLLVRVMGVFYRVPLNNLIGDAGIGTYGDAYQIYSIFLILASVGVPTVLSKLMGERIAAGRYAEARNFFRKTAIFILSVSATLSLLMWFGSPFLANALFKNPDAVPAIRVLAPTIVLVSAMSLLRGYFNSFNNMTPNALSQLIEGFLHAVFSVLMAYLLFSLGTAKAVAGGISGTLIGAVGGLLFLILCFLAFRKNNPLMAVKASDSSESTGYVMKEMLFMLFPLMLNSVVFTVKSLLDTSVFTHLMTAQGYTPEALEAMRGIYTGKYLVFLNVPIALGDSLAVALVPSIASSLALGAIKDVKDKMGTAVRTVLLIALPAAAGLAVLGKPIVMMFFPASPNGGELFWLGSAAAIFYSLANIHAAILQGSGQQHRPLINAAVSAAASMLVLLILVSVFKLGIFALPLSYTIFSFLLMTLDIVSVRRHLKLRVSYLKAMKKPLICSVLMGIVCMAVYVLTYSVFKSNALSVLVSIVAAVLAYFLLMMNFGGITEKDLENIPGGRFLRWFKL